LISVSTHPHTGHVAQVLVSSISAAVLAVVTCCPHIIGHPQPVQYRATGPGFCHSIVIPFMLSPFELFGGGRVDPRRFTLPCNALPCLAKPGRVPCLAQPSHAKPSLAEPRPAEPCPAMFLALPRRAWPGHARPSRVP